MNPLDDLQATFADINEVVTSVTLALAAATDDTLDEAIDGALGAIARHEQADRAYVTLWADDGTLGTSHEWVADGIQSHRHAIVAIQLSAFPYSVAKARYAALWHVPELAELPPEAHAERESFQAFGVRSVLEVPMRNSQGTFGVVGFNHVRSSRDWSPITIDLVRRVAEIIGYALCRRATNRELRAARDAAELANHAQDRFMSHLSHELRTPLHAILGFAELLDDPGRPAHEQAAVRQILESGRELQSLLDELLARADGRPTAPSVDFTI